MPKIAIPAKHINLILNAASSLDGQLGFVYGRLLEALGSGTPAPEDLLLLRQAVNALRDSLAQAGNSSNDFQLPIHFGPALKTVLLFERRTIAGQVDSFRRNTKTRRC